MKAGIIGMGTVARAAAYCGWRQQHHLMCERANRLKEQDK